MKTESNDGNAVFASKIPRKHCVSRDLSMKKTVVGTSHATSPWYESSHIVMIVQFIHSIAWFCGHVLLFQRLKFAHSVLRWQREKGPQTLQVPIS